MTKEYFTAENKKLKGKPIAIKDCICVKDMETTCSSAILKGYRPVFDATAVKKLKEKGYDVAGKTIQDEFGYGSFNLNVGTGYEIPKNPFDKQRTCGGSSGGSAAVVQKYSMPALAESTGGSIVCPAAFCGVIGLCPTYGRVSRYGLIDYANSLDKIGVMSKTIEETEKIYHIIKGKDENDSTSVSADDFEDKKIRIAVLKRLEGVENDVQLKIDETVRKLKSKGYVCENIDLPLNKKYALAVYYIIAMAETSTNLAKYCGLRYGTQEKIEGNFNEYFTKIRSMNFGKETKRRLMLGTFIRMAGYRDAYYIKALKVRKLLINEYKQVFKKYQIILCPTMPVLPPKISEIEKLTPMQNYAMDILTVGPNLAGLPHISVNAGFTRDLPVGVMFTADHFHERNLFRIARELE